MAAVAGIAVALSIQVSDAAPPAASAPHGAMSTKASGGASPHGSAMGAQPPGHPNGIPSDTKLVNSGNVLEVLDSPAYTFMRVKGPKGEVWLAAYKAEIAKGDAIRYSSGISMPNFYSKSLDRTFKEIVFVDTVELVKK